MVDPTPYKDGDRRYLSMSKKSQTETELKTQTENRTDAKSKTSFFESRASKIGSVTKLDSVIKQPLEYS